MDKIKEAEEAADSYNVGKEAAKGGTYEQKLNRININHAYKDGYIAGAGKYEALLREAVEALKAASGHIDYLTGTDTTVMGLRLKALITKSKSILND